MGKVVGMDGKPMLVSCELSAVVEGYDAAPEVVLMAMREWLVVECEKRGWRIRSWAAGEYVDVAE